MANRTFRSVDAGSDGLKDIVRALPIGHWNGVDGDLTAPVNNDVVQKRLIANSILFLEVDRINANPNRTVFQLLADPEALPRLVKFVQAGSRQTVVELKCMVCKYLALGYRGNLHFFGGRTHDGPYACHLSFPIESREVTVVLSVPNDLDAAKTAAKPVIETCLKHGFVEIPSLF